jgi:hypothetical protein
MSWEGFMQMERVQLAERASGKMRRAIGRVLPGESREELERIAAKDQRLARWLREGKTRREVLLQAHRRLNLR